MADATQNLERCKICGVFRWDEDIGGVMIKKGRFLEEHHISYEPEITVMLCEVCHWRVHNEGGFHDHLMPEQTRMNWMMKKRSKPGFFEIRKRMSESGIYEDDDNVVRVIHSTPDPYHTVAALASEFQGLIELEHVFEIIYPEEVNQQ